MNVWSRRAMGAGAGITLGLLAGLAVLAQSQASSADSATQPRRQIQMVQAQATLDSTLDAKKAKQGEAVSAKLEGKRADSRCAGPAEEYGAGRVCGPGAVFGAQERFPDGGHF